jgi:hypothetical protein
MQEEIISYLREHPEGVSSQTLAELFLKFKKPEPLLAHMAISAILKNDIRCRMGNKNVWFAEIKKVTGSSLRNEPFTAVYCLTDPSRLSRKLFYISICNIFENQLCTFNSWLADSTSQVAKEAHAFFDDAILTTKDTMTTEEVIQKVHESLKNRIPVFITSFDYSIVKDILSQFGFYLTDNVVLLSELMSAAGFSIPRPLTLDSASHELNHPIGSITDIHKASEHFTLILQEVIDSLLTKGIETIESLEALSLKKHVDYFKGKEFSLSTIQSLPTGSGVYGFKDKNDNFIYIGKAKNLKRRLTGYFRETDESPEKIDQLRKDSHTLITYQCGSEIEAIIYEYRLIRKHTPVLNSQTNISERPGYHKPISDCIIILPHAQNSKLVLLLLRQNQKIILKQLDTAIIDKSILSKDIEDYFFKDTLPAEKTDFPEIELATRWIKNNRDSLTILEVFNYTNALEITDIITDQIRSIIEEKALSASLYSNEND